MKNLGLKAAFATVAAVVVAGVGGCGVTMHKYYHENKEQVTINDKQVQNSGNSSKYVIFTDKGVKEDSDSIIKWKFNSSDVYAQLKTGCTYDITEFGWRSHFLSMYPNIINAKGVPTKACPKP